MNNILIQTSTWQNAGQGVFVNCAAVESHFSKPGSGNFVVGIAGPGSKCVVADKEADLWSIAEECSIDERLLEDYAVTAPLTYPQESDKVSYIFPDAKTKDVFFFAQACPHVVS